MRARGLPDSGLCVPMVGRKCTVGVFSVTQARPPTDHVCGSRTWCHVSGQMVSSQRPRGVKSAAKWCQVSGHVVSSQRPNCAKSAVKWCQISGDMVPSQRSNGAKSAARAVVVGSSNRWQASGRGISWPFSKVRSSWWTLQVHSLGRVDSLTIAFRSQ
jgi:hypothetical protein